MDRRLKSLDLALIQDSIEMDPTNLINYMSQITNVLQQSCLDYPQNNLRVWSVLHPLLKQLEDLHAPALAFERPESPKCPQKPVSTVRHGEEWQDSYSWLTDRNDPEVLEYIQSENSYSQKLMNATKPIQDLLYCEFLSRLDQTAESSKVQKPDGFSYYQRKVPGQEYPVNCRVDKNGVEHVYLDENELANSKEFEDASFFKVAAVKLSPDCKIVAYGVDLTGQERYTVFFKRLADLKVLPDSIPNVDKDFEFSNDCKSVYYSLLDSQERAFQVKRHLLGADCASDTVMFHEEDEMFYVTLSKTDNNEYIILKSSAQVTNESHYITAKTCDSTPQMIIPRRENIHYTCKHHGNHFYILTNEGGKNNWIFRVPVSDVGSIKNYNDLVKIRSKVIEHRDFVLIEDFEFKANHMIVLERSNCVQNLRIVHIDATTNDFSSYHYVGFSEAVYSIWLGSVDESVTYISRRAFETNVIRFTYCSFVQPKQTVEYDMYTRNLTIIHEEKVVGAVPYNSKMYESKRLYATSYDGTAVPVSIVYRKDLLGKNQEEYHPNPLLLHAYGAYGACANPRFSTNRLSLLDRGFIYAVAHTRGGADMGNAWYDDGKLLKKKNTFNDFCSVAEYLIKEGYTIPSKLAIYGRSAGGLLIGAAINMRPNLFQAALTEVPFVDVINTMFNSSIPWTAFEFEEWGNPEDPEIYKVMKDYCPYSNIDGKKMANNEYPNLLVICGMNDPRVAFFEPLKLIAKMRNERAKWRKTLNIPKRETDRYLLLKIDDAGHGGNSGEYSHLEDLASQYAFLIDNLQAPVKATEMLFPAMHERGKRRKAKKEEDTYTLKKGLANPGRGRLFQWMNNLL